jgi:O-antigen/teichoic acid export membrane protein
LGSCQADFIFALRERDVSVFKVWIWRGGLVTIAPVADVASRFARTAILARFLTPHELGTAVALTVVIGTAGLVTDMAFDKFVMTKPGDVRVLGAAQFLSVLRGALVAGLVFVSAPLIAAGFGVPEFASSFAVVAAVPLISGLAHLGTKQVEGRFDYAPEMTAQISAAIAGIIVIVPTIYVWPDHRAMIAGLITQSLVYCIASHVVARMPYRLLSDKTTLKSVLSYGLPLTLNGIGLAVISQFDRILVGHWLNVSTLALYAIILSFSGMPISLMDRVFGKLALSYLVTLHSAQDSVADNAEKYAGLVFIFSVLATAYALFVALALDILVPVIFGHNFSVTPAIHALITARVFVLLQINGAPSRLLLATGRTGLLALISACSGFGLLLALILIQWSPSIEAVLLGTVVVDLIRLPVIFIAANKDVGSENRKIMSDVTIACVVATVIIGTLMYDPELSWNARGIVLCVGALAICFQVVLGFCQHHSLRKVFFRDQYL